MKLVWHVQYVQCVNEFVSHVCGSNYDLWFAPVYVFEKKNRIAWKKNKENFSTISFISAACLCNLVVFFWSNMSFVSIFM